MSSNDNQSYTRRSLRRTARGLAFQLRNRTRPATLLGIGDIRVDDEKIAPEKVQVSIDGADPLPASGLTGQGDIPMPLGTVLEFEILDHPGSAGSHSIGLGLETRKRGWVKIEATDVLAEEVDAGTGIPRDRRDNCSSEIIEQRRAFLRSKTGVLPEALTGKAFDPHVTAGNIENFIGVAQVPIGLAGPLVVHGDHADGEFYVPLATSEGTLVASYNRGMKLLRQSGGVRCTVVDRRMQRAPVFMFRDATGARTFARWVDAHLDDIRAVANRTDRFVELLEIECFLVHRSAFLRFSYATGDAAGQNMVGSATFAACNWILQTFDSDEVEHFFLEANIATDKKPSAINRLLTRGTRVTAEATIRDADLRDILNTDAEALHRFANVANIGALMAGTGNNGCHSVNGITALFIATGQDIANVSEASDAFIYTEVIGDGDLYISVTIPSLIVATVGGGTGLPTQSECLSILGCRGVGNAKKLAEIVAGTVLAGELSLAGAITAMDWVASHEQLGRNPPEETPEVTPAAPSA